jgi:hypothetical protein
MITDLLDAVGVVLFVRWIFAALVVKVFGNVGRALATTSGIVSRNCREAL